jgi:hypothetical protein
MWPAMEHGTDLGALVDENVDQGTSDGTGRSGYEDHAKASYLHRCLNKFQYLGKIPPLEAADQEERPQEDRHFTLLVSTGHEASALREAVSSSRPEVCGR